MKGHIRKRGKTSWAIVLDLGRDAAGKRRQKWHSVKGTRKDAEREVARLVNEMNNGAYIEPSRMKVDEYLERWLKEYAEPRVSPKTYERYAAIVRQNIVPAIGNYALSKLNPLHIQSFYTEALSSGRKSRRGGLSAQTVVHFHRVLRKALDQAIKWQLLARNPADAVEPPKVPRQQMRALNENEAAALIRLVKGGRLHLPVFIAVTTGLRRGEILALRWEDLDLELGQVVVCRSLEQTKNGLRFKSPKTERGRRMVTLPGITLAELKSHKATQAQDRLALGPAYEDHGLVCPRIDGSPWPPDAFSTAFADLIRKSDLPHVRFHDLRHSHATQLLRQGVHPKVVSERLGHSNIGITLDTYSHVLPGMQEQASALVDAAMRSAMADAPANK